MDFRIFVLVAHRSRNSGHYGAVLCCLMELRGLLGVRFGNVLQPFTAFMIGVILAMLGPGAYSLDSRIFGRQLLRLPSRDQTDGY